MKYSFKLGIPAVSALAACVLWLAAAQASAAEVVVAAASDLNFAFKEVITQFERQTGTEVRLTLGSSGNLFSQIQNGAPFDLYFSADIRYPQKLEQSGHGVPASLYQYAVGRIVVWTRKQSALAVESRGMEVLLDPSIRRIAIANPKHAPYGRAAEAALKHFQVYEPVRAKLVLGENISQAAQFVESGAADVGIIALSLALAPAMTDLGRFWMVPAEAHPPLEQGAVLLKNGANQDAARAFLEFIKGTEGRDIMRRNGFVVPGDKAP
ncbi:MAG TPA: molybdate ABC transporter substrate-binding protein [Nitrospiraceae bacterium]|jgi:molybdate transport system substrate-binding protein